jgi:hypothetical protein
MDDVPSDDFALENCFPNPFNPSTQLGYVLPEVSLIFYDVLGRVVAVLARGYRDAGTYTVTWNVAETGASSGVYLYVFKKFRTICGLS